MTFTGFQGLTLGIKDPDIFKIPKICKHAKAATEVSRATFDMILFHVKSEHLIEAEVLIVVV